MNNSKTTNRRWTREESFIVFNLYCKIPFKDSSKTHPDVCSIAKLIGRTPSAVNMKVGNFGSFDPELRKRGIVGLGNTSALDKEVWDEFHNNWETCVAESEKLIKERMLDNSISSEQTEYITQEGKEKMVMTKVRENQQFFRQAVLSAYDNKCCVTGIEIRPLLLAGHIKPWSQSTGSEKLDPQNGLCLNALHDKAFDRGFITITTDYEIKVSDQIAQSANPATQAMLLRYKNQRINLPSRFLPRKYFLQWHQDNIFLNN